MRVRVHLLIFRFHFIHNFLFRFSFAALYHSLTLIHSISFIIFSVVYIPCISACLRMYCALAKNERRSFFLLLSPSSWLRCRWCALLYINLHPLRVIQQVTILQCSHSHTLPVIKKSLFQYHFWFFPIFYSTVSAAVAVYFRATECDFINHVKGIKSIISKNNTIFFYCRIFLILNRVCPLRCAQVLIHHRHPHIRIHNEIWIFFAMSLLFAFSTFLFSLFVFLRWWWWCVVTAAAAVFFLSFSLFFQFFLSFSFHCLFSTCLIAMCTVWHSRHDQTVWEGRSNRERYWFRVFAWYVIGCISE